MGDVQRAISDAIGTEIVRLTSLSGGCIASVYRAELADGTMVVAKSGSALQAGGLDVEAWMLGYLAEHSELPVPKVLHAEPGLLVMEHIESAGGVSDAGEARAAELFATLHSTTADRYGMERDTLIGPLVQPNAHTTSWCEFYAERRLRHFGRIALERGGIDAATMKLVERVCARIGGIIGKPGPPSLVHGDAWGGNVLCRDGEVVALIDPAIHYADAEVELAFMTLFGTFGEAFFARYHELRPIRPGFFEERKDLYLLYPLLVHAALFESGGGGGYGQRVRAIAKRFS